jgi:hypothetical protein
MVRILVTVKTELVTISWPRVVPSGRSYRRYVIPTMLDNATQGKLQRYENNYKTLNLTTTALDRNVYDESRI